MDKFLKWLKKKENIWQNILYKKTNCYINFSNINNDLYSITDKTGKILNFSKQMLIGYMIEYLIELEYKYGTEYISDNKDFLIGSSTDRYNLLESIINKIENEINRDT